MSIIDECCEGQNEWLYGTNFKSQLSKPKKSLLPSQPNEALTISDAAPFSLGDKCLLVYLSSAFLSAIIAPVLVSFVTSELDCQISGSPEGPLL